MQGKGPELATEFAFTIMMAVASKIVKKEKVTSDELKLAGRALGWLGIATKGTDADFLNSMLVSLKSVKAPPSAKLPDQMSRSFKPTGHSIGIATAAAAGGRRRRMKGGMLGLKDVILGAAVWLIGGLPNRTDYDTTFNATLHQVQKNCPWNLEIGPPGTLDRIVGIALWDDSYDRKKAEYDALVDSCDGTRATAQDRIQDAYDDFVAARDRVLDTTETIARTAGRATGWFMGPLAGYVIGETAATAARDYADTVVSGAVIRNHPTNLDTLQTTLGSRPTPPLAPTPTAVPTPPPPPTPPPTPSPDPTPFRFWPFGAAPTMVPRMSDGYPIATPTMVPRMDDGQSMYPSATPAATSSFTPTAASTAIPSTTPASTPNPSSLPSFSATPRGSRGGRRKRPTKRRKPSRRNPKRTKRINPKN